MKTNENVSRRQFLLLGAMAGSGLVLSESGCAPKAEQTEPSATSSATGSLKPKRAFGSRRSKLPPHGDTSLLTFVEKELPNAYPVIRNVNTDQLIGVFNITGAVDKPLPSPEFNAHIRDLSIEEILVKLFPSIQFTVSLNTSGSNLAGTYRLHPKVSGSSTGNLITTPIGDRTLVDIGLMLCDFTFTVTRNGAKIGDYQICGSTFTNVSPATDPGLFVKHGNLNLHEIGDLLESMAFTVQKIAPLSSKGRLFLTPLSTMTVMVMGNKYRRE